MRQISFEEARAVGGSGCEDLTLSLGLTGVSFSGSLSTWQSCYTQISNSIGDSLSGYGAHYTSGIPYGMTHIA